MESLFSIPYLPYVVGGLILFVAWRSLGSLSVNFSVDDILGKLLGPSYAETQMLKKAERMKRDGDHLGAARMYEDCGRLEEAAQVLVQGQEYYAAGAVIEKLGKHERAAELYLQAGDAKKAAEQFTAAGKAARAAVLFLEKGNNLEAAKLFGTAGMWDRAGELFAKSGYNQRAADAWDKAGDPLKAAEAWERHFLENVSYGTTYSSTAVSPDQKAALTAGRLYLKAGDAARAVEILVKGAFFREAAEASLARGHHARAAELFLRADDTERAADAWEKAGDAVQAANLRGEVALKKEQFVEAAAFFVKAKDYARAAELYEQTGHLREAAGAYEAADSHAAAGSVYVRAGLKAEAAASYEKAGEHDTAAQLFVEAGQPARAVALFERAGHFYRAGETALAGGDRDRALALLQRVGPDDEHFGAATERVAALLIQAGRAELARERLQKGLTGATVTAANLELHYLLASAHEAAGDIPAALALFKKIEAENLKFRDAGARARRLEAMGPVATADRRAPAPAPPAAPAPATPAGPPPPSTTPGARFALREEIGRGPLGVVHRGEEASGRPVAMRLLPERFARDATLLVALAGDVKAASQVSNAHVAKVLGLVDAGNGRPCVVGELVQGRNLADPLKSGARMAVQQVHSLARVLAQTLSILHARGLVHGSVQPSNVMVAAGTVKLMDLGLGRLAQMRRPEDSYRAPGAKLDTANDLHDLATLMYHLLTGVHPRTLPQGAGLPLPSSYVSTIPESMDRLLVRCLHPREDLRLPTADALLAELREMVKIS